MDSQIESTNSAATTDAPPKNGQQYLDADGMKPPSHEDIDAAAEAYVEIRDSRMKLTDKEVEAKGALLAKMQEHKLTTYRDLSTDPVLIVSIEDVDVKVKVKKEKGAPE